MTETGRADADADMRPEIAPVERMETGVTRLDDILGGGLVRGAAYIVEGPPGAGKTVMANQICHERARRGEAALYLTLLAESFGRMVSHLLGVSFFEPACIP